MSAKENVQPLLEAAAGHNWYNFRLDNAFSPAYAGFLKKAG
ncbi:MAG TPA: hypothetical protein VMA35_02460 [Candidatus Sulfopaludibacter sp.]|nr:hypothetical protein [Candidatus Sulfopaludibacter sp.]